MRPSLSKPISTSCSWSRECVALDQVLAPLFDPAHRPAKFARQKRHQQVFGIDMALAAEAAADIERDAAHPRLGQPQQRGGFAAHPMNHLGRGPDRRRVGARIVGADDAAALHRHGGVAVVIEAAPQPVRRAGQRRCRHRPCRPRTRRSGWSRSGRGRSGCPGATPPRGRPPPAIPRDPRSPVRPRLRPGRGSPRRRPRSPRRHAAPCRAPIAAAAD